MGRYCPITQKGCTYLDCQECGKDRMCDKFFCLVAGSRTFDDYQLMQKKLDYMLSMQEDVVIVHGGANGADSLAGRYAKERGYEAVVFPAEWEKYGKRAGHIRNEKMFRYISRMEKHAAIAFWDGKSRGTLDDIRLADEMGIRMKVVRFNKKEENRNMAYGSEAENQNLQAQVQEEIRKAEAGEGIHSLTQLKAILRELQADEEGKMVFSFPHFIADSWDYADPLGQRLLEYARRRN